MWIAAALVGIGTGMLFAAVGAGLWSAYRQTAAVRQGARAAAWSGAGVLVVAGLLAWGSGLPALEAFIGMVDRRSLEGPVLSLMLMAALAVPLRVEAEDGARWGAALLYVPAFLLALGALLRIAMRDQGAPGQEWVTPVRFSLAVCAGLGARSLGRSLLAIWAGSSVGEWCGALAYGLTTLVFGSTTMLNLWRRGAVWTGANPVTRGGITGAWLVWSAAWLAPSRHPRLRAALTTAAALLLILVAIKPS